MGAVVFTVETRAEPERVMAAATDFSDRRPELWPTISRRYWQVHACGERWAECTEGSDVLGGVWVRARYEWTPARLTGTVLSSNVFASGTWALEVEPRPGGGALVHANNEFRTHGRGVVIAPVIRLAGRRFFSARLMKTIRILEAA